jgi:serine protease AprX
MNKLGTPLRWTTRALAVVVCLAAAAPAHAQAPAHHGKFDQVVRDAVRTGRGVRAIVRFKDDAARQRGAWVVASRGGFVRRALNDVRALTVDVDADTADTLAVDTGVLTLSIDAEVRASGLPPRSARSSGAKNARQRFNRHGSGLTVAVIDSGVRPHADLPAWRIRKFVDFVNGRTAPYDDFGHGTHVAGIIAGSGAASAALDGPYVGAAPGVDIVALKVLDGNGAGSTSDVIAALEWVAANHLLYNIRVVNLSLGHPVFEPSATDPLVQAADALVRRGIVVVASAGNLGIDPLDGEVGYGGVTSPANGPSIIAVGAVDTKTTDARSDDRVASYSSRGPTRFDVLVKPDLVAAGHHVVSLSAPGSFLFTNFPSLHVPVGNEATPFYMTLSGTSMAAPVVSGAAALVLNANPRLSAGAVRAVLSFTAQVLPDTNLMSQGAGYVNTLGAVRLAALLKARVDVGQVWLRLRDGLPRASDELFGEQVAWGKRVIWGDGVLLGDSAYVHLAAWDDNIVWGQDLDNIVWGQCEDDGCDNIVWGQCTEEGCDNIVWGQCTGEDCDNIVWGQDDFDNIVWGQCETAACDNIVWGQDGDNIVWGQCTGADCDNIVWGQCGEQGCDNIVWGQCEGDACDNIVWGQNGLAHAYWASNTVWGFWSNGVNWTTVSSQDDNIVWGQDYLDNIVWGQNTNIVWGQCGQQSCDNIVWGQSLAILTGGGF